MTAAVRIRQSLQYVGPAFEPFENSNHGSTVKMNNGLMNSCTFRKNAVQNKTKYSSSSFTATASIVNWYNDHIKLLASLWLVQKVLPSNHKVNRLQQRLTRKVAFSRQQFQWRFWQTLGSLFSLDIRSICMKFGMWFHTNVHPSATKPCLRILNLFLLF